MLEGTRLGLVLQVLEPLGHTVEAEFGEQAEGGMGQHDRVPFNEVAGAAQVGVDRHGLAGPG